MLQWKLMQWAKNKHGFTIVELLIVVVVIAILAAITIVAYNGIQTRTKHSAAQSGASQVAKRLQVFAVQNNDMYPDSLSEINVNDSGQTSYQYFVDNNAAPKTFCVTVTVQNVSYYQSTTQQSPVAGACSGHGLNGLPPNLAVNPSFEIDAAAITTRVNYSTNPSFETNATNWSTVNAGTGSSITTSTAQAQSGSRSLIYTYGDGTTQDSGPLSSISATAATTYTISAWIYAPASISTGLRIIAFGSAMPTTERGSITAAVGSWTRISYTATTTSAGTLSFAVGKATNNNDTGKILYVDSVLVEQTPSLNYYFSGGSSATGDFTYTWNGTPDLSASSERAQNIANYSLNGTGAARLQSSVREVSGDHSARVLLTSTAVNPGLYQAITLQPGTYTFIVKVWSEAGSGGVVSLTSQGTGVSVVNVSGYPSTTTIQGQWVELRRLVTVTTAGPVTNFVYIPGTYTSVGNSFWIDEYAVVSGNCTAAVCY